MARELLVLIGTSLLLAAPAAAQSPRLAERFQHEQWPAFWIAAQDGPSRDAGVFHFRRTLRLAAVPARLVVHVSADNRYLLHVNGRRVGGGPARSDVLHWGFESYDIAPFLRPGENRVAATVWNFGTLSPMAQMSRRTGFLLQGDDEAASALDTSRAWEAAYDPGHGPNPDGAAPLRARHFYYAAGPGERRDGSLYDWDWDGDGSPAERWKPARELNHGYPHSIRKGPGWLQSPEGWLFEPHELPAMEHREIAAGRVVRASGIEAGSFPAAPLRVAAASEARLLLDQGEIVNAYPELRVSGGKGAVVQLTYAEALYDANGQKGDRNDIRDKEVAGLYDELVAGGGRDRRFSPLWWRSWRYLELHVKTAGEPLVIEGLKAFATGFPFEKRARFASDDPELERIFDVSFRTMRLAGHETYMDAPYWEQLQYVGDTRIDALLNYALAGEDRLARRAMLHFDWSRGGFGMTQSRYPTAEVQLIPPYALFFVSMVHDYWSWRDDPAFVRDRLPATRASIDWFLARLRPDGLLGFLPYWIHVDTGTSQDEAIKEEDGRSLGVTLQLVETLRQAAELEDALGDPGRSAAYRRQADVSLAAVSANFDEDKQLLPDTPARRTWGHPVNIWGLVNGAIPPASRAATTESVLAVSRHPAGRAKDGGRGAPWPLEQVPSASLYFRFYLGRALEATGRGDEYVSLLQPWRDLLAKGLTTWPEHPEPSRSDCHAWSAHPALDLLRIVAGIAPDAPGFARARIAPHLGPLARVEAAVPTPRGEIAVAYRREGARLQAEISLPPGLGGRFVWNGREQALGPGTTRLTVE
jgi:alpha-L-rhamnosidase